MSDSLPRVTVADVIARYLRHSTVEGIHGESARVECEFTFGKFVAECGHHPVETCKPYMLSDFIAAHPEWKSTATRRKKAAVIRAAFQWAWAEERIARNPFKNIRYAEAERRPEMPDESLALILDVANKHAERVLWFIRLTACRVTEACRANWSDVDWQRKTWIIGLHKTRKQTRKPKTVGLVDEALALLRELAGANSAANDSAIFLNTRGKRWNATAIWRAVDRAKDKLGIECGASTHGIRHRAASAMVIAGAPLALVAAQLGHANTTTTEKYYVHLENQMDAIRAAASLGVAKRLSA